nr:copper resistance protein CopC [Corynebacterium caspium]
MLVMLLAVTMIFSPRAEAHDSVINSDPAAEAVIAEFPRTITLEFSGEPRPNFNTVAISNAATGEVLFSGQPQLNGHIVSLDLPADLTGGPGEYLIGFQITSSDGHATRGKTTFTVAANPGSEASSVASPTAAGDSTTASDANNPVENNKILILSGFGFLLAAAVLAVRFWKPRK